MTYETASLLAGLLCCAGVARAQEAAAPDVPAADVAEELEAAPVEVPAPAATAPTPAESSEPTAVDEPAPPSTVTRLVERLHGSVLEIDQSVTPDTAFRSTQQSAVPSYQLWFSFRPRYYVTPELSVRLRLDLTTELLNAEETTRKHEPQLGDTWTEVAYGLPEVWGIKPTAALRAIWPTSKASLAEGSVTRLGPVLSATRSFDTGLGGFEVAATAYGLYNLTTHTSGGTQSSYGCQTVDFAPSGSCTQNTGKMDSQVSMTAFLSGKYAPIEPLSATLFYAIIDNWTYAPPDVTLTDVTGGVTSVPRAAGGTRLSQAGWFLASVDYELTDWVSLSLGYSCLRSVLNGDSSYGNPFYKAGGATRVSLTGGFNLDKVMARAADLFAGPSMASTTSAKPD